MKRLKDWSDESRQIFSAQLYDPTKVYIDSPYIYKHDYENCIILFNFITKQVVCYNKEEDISDEFLIENWFKIPQDCDIKSIAWYVQQGIRKKFNDSVKNRKDLDSVTIMTTLACNARCEYCFERGVEPVSMTEEEAHKVAQTIASKARDRVSITWFGGEPLVNTKAMDIISSDLESKGVNFRSQLVTNGYLLDNYSIYDLAYKWRIEDAQITLDGTESEYLKIKNYKNNDPNAYKKVINNIKFLLEHDIKVYIRLNISQNNVEDVSALSEDLCKEFEKYNNLFIYCAPINQLDHKAHDEENRTIDIGVDRITRNIEKHKKFGSTPAVYEERNHHCVVDCGTQICFLPGNKTSLCWECHEKAIIGTYDNLFADLEKVNRLKVKNAETERCKTCPYYPLCFKFDYCLGDRACSDAAVEEFEYRIKRDLERLYREKNGKI